MSVMLGKVLLQKSGEQRGYVFVPFEYLLHYSWNVLMLLKSEAKAVNGLITPNSEWCGIKAIRYDLVLCHD